MYKLLDETDTQNDGTNFKEKGFLPFSYSASDLFLSWSSNLTIHKSLQWAEGHSLTKYRQSGMFCC